MKKIIAILVSCIILFSFGALTASAEDAMVIDFGDMIYPIGDVNCDEVVDAGDLPVMRKVLLGVESFEREALGYTNADDVFDVRDLVHLKKVISGAIETL
jgi:hypothetical protein